MLKIRLQLQIHALPDRSSQTSASAASHLLRRGTIQIFKKILHEEGVTVNYPPNVILVIHHQQLAITIFSPALGVLERKRPSRTPLRNIRLHPIFPLPLFDSDPLPPLPPHIRRVLYIRRSRRRRRHNSHLPFRSPPHTFRCSGARQSLRESAKQYSHHCP